MWAAATCVGWKPPSALEQYSGGADGWSVRDDVVDQTDLIDHNDAVQGKAAFLERRALDKVARLICKAAESNLALRATIDSACRKLNLGQDWAKRRTSLATQVDGVQLG